MQDKLLEKYHELTLQIEALEEQKSALSGEIQTALKIDGLEKLQCQFGTFSLVKTESAAVRLERGSDNGLGLSRCSIEALTEWPISSLQTKAL